jgi:hypothetical protein
MPLVVEVAHTTPYRNGSSDHVISAPFSIPIRSIADGGEASRDLLDAEISLKLALVLIKYPDSSNTMIFRK